MASGFVEDSRYGIETPNEKRAAILCRQAESAMFVLVVKQNCYSNKRAGTASAYVLTRAASVQTCVE